MCINNYTTVVLMPNLDDNIIVWRVDGEQTVFVEQIRLKKLH